MKRMASRLLCVFLVIGMLTAQISAYATRMESFAGNVSESEIPAVTAGLPSNAPDDAESPEDVSEESVLPDANFSELGTDLERRLDDLFASGESDAAFDILPADDSGESAVSADDSGEYETLEALENGEWTLPLTAAEGVNPQLPSGEVSALLDAAHSGVLPGGLEWNVTDGTLTVSGKGTMPNYQPASDSFAPWAALAVSSVVIGDGVENIGDYAFYDMSGIRSVKIGSGVQEIGGYAFLYCEGLTSVILPDSVTVLRRGAFFQCSSLADITLSKNLTLIYEGAFQRCSSLKSVVFPESLKGIGTSAFMLCSSLESVTLPNGLQAIAENVFQGCEALRTVTTSGPAGEAAGVIGNEAFAGCSSLESVQIPASVVKLGTSLFHSCTSLATVELPPNLRTMGQGVFYQCESLRKVELPESVTELGSYMFALCSQLEEVRLPGNMTTLPPYFFAKCDALKAVELPANVSMISEHAFWDCLALERAPLPEKLTSIGEKAFEGCKSLREIMIPDSVSEIGAQAFANCSSAVALKLPSSLREVKIGAFYAVPGQDTLDIPAQIASIGEMAFAGNHASEISLPDGLKSVGKHAFVGNPNLASVTLPDSVEEVGEGAFRNCKGLRRATLSRSMKAVPQYCFYLDEKLEEVVLPHGIEEIGSIAFGNCESLREITLPDSVKKLGLAPFGYCKSLTRVDIPSSVTFLGSAVFYHCESLREVYLPDSITTLASMTFLGCTSLERVVLPSGIDTLEFWMFADCSNLTDVAIPGSVKSIEEAAFQGCEHLTNIYYGSSWANWKTLKKEEGNNPLEKAEKHYRIERGKPTVLYNLGRLDVSVGLADDLTDAHFDADGAYAIPLEDNPLFPVRIQFSYERDQASLVSETVWFYDGNDVAEINGHTFSLRYQGTPRFVGVRFLGETVYALSEQTPFINDMDNQRPEEPAERQELFLHLEDRLWGELRNVELILPDGSSAQWLNNSNVDLSRSIDLAKLGLGNHGDLVMDLNITGASEFLCRVHALFLPPEDLLAFRMEDANGEIQINSLSFTLQEDEPSLLKSDAYTLMVDRTPNIGGTVKLGLGFHDGQMAGISVTVYQGAYAGEQEAASGKDITAQVWRGADYPLPAATSYESAPELTLVFRRGDKVAQVMPVSIVLVADLISLTPSSYLYAGTLTLSKVVTLWSFKPFVDRMNSHCKIGV